MRSKGICKIVGICLLLILTVNYALVKAESEVSTDPRTLQAFTERIEWGILSSIFGGLACATVPSTNPEISTWEKLLENPNLWHESPFSTELKAFKNKYAFCSTIATTLAVVLHTLSIDKTLVARDLAVPALGTAMFAWIGNAGGLMLSESNGFAHDLQTLNAPAWVSIAVNLLYPSSFGSLFSSGMFPIFVYGF